VRFQNENLVAVRDGAVMATAPGFDRHHRTLTSGQAITTERLRYGHRAVVLGIPCPAAWRTPAGIDLGGVLAISATTSTTCQSRPGSNH